MPPIPQVNICSGLFSQEEIAYLTNHETVRAYGSVLERTLHPSHVSFVLELPESIRTKLIDTMGLSFLNTQSHIPLRWSKGDIQEHVDRSFEDQDAFEDTYLIYVTDSPGEFVLGDQSYGITSNTGFVFSHDTRHRVANTGNHLRLMIGPVNEFGHSVGGPTLTFNSIAPNNGLVNDTVTISFSLNDANFTLQSVLFDTTAATNLVVTGSFPDYCCTCNVPSGSGTVQVVLNASYDGSNVSSGTLPFTYNPPPVSNTCFPAGTPVSTDQGDFPIETIDPLRHTISRKRIVAVTKTLSSEKYLVCFEKHALEWNCPSEKTVMSPEHKVHYKGQWIESRQLLSSAIVQGVKPVAYNGELLYNLLMEHHDAVRVNRMLCETLHPDNAIAKLYTTSP